MNAATELSRLRQFLSGQEDVRLAIVFGSVADGRAGRDSDLDIAVAVGKPLTSARKQALIEALAKITGRPIDLVDLATAGEPLLGRILAGGRRLSGDDADYARLVSRHLFDQADFLPYRDRMLEERRRRWIGR